VIGEESLKFEEWEHVGIEKVDHLFRDMLRGSIRRCLEFLPGNLQILPKERRPGAPSIVLLPGVKLVKIGAAVRRIEAKR
jgi:hypothetical protein